MTHIPTCHLRFVRREVVTNCTDGYRYRTDQTTVLQQWWEKVPNERYAYEIPNAIDGEWRDIPLELSQ